MNTSTYQRALDEHAHLVHAVAALEPAVYAAAQQAAHAIQKGCKILFCGNGGSASDSLHLAAELMGRLVENRQPLAALALNADGPVMTCIANDFSFEQVFARQVEGLGQVGDVLVAISTSGQSPNVLAAAKAARQKGMSIIGLLGRDGGALLEWCDHPIVVPSFSTARIQEMHIMMGHVWCELIEQFVLQTFTPDAEGG